MESSFSSIISTEISFTTVLKLFIIDSVFFNALLKFVLNLSEYIFLEIIYILNIKSIAKFREKCYNSIRHNTMRIAKQL